MRSRGQEVKMSRGLEIQGPRVHIKDGQSFIWIKSDSVINCKLLNKDENEKLPEYEEILKSNAATQLQIAKKFMKNMKIRKKS